MKKVNWGLLIVVPALSAALAWMIADITRQLIELNRMYDTIDEN